MRRLNLSPLTAFQSSDDTDLRVMHLGPGVCGRGFKSGFGVQVLLASGLESGFKDTGSEPQI